MLREKSQRLVELNAELDMDAAKNAGRKRPERGKFRAGAVKEGGQMSQAG